MNRGGWLRRRTPLRAQPNPGSGIRPENRAAVLIRDANVCVRCGVLVANIPASVHHRKPRGRGGKDNLANLLLLCGGGSTRCHGDVEYARVLAYREGYLVQTGVSPATVPVLTWTGWVVFHDDGTTSRRDADAGGVA